MHYTMNEGSSEYKIDASHKCPVPFTAGVTGDNVAIAGATIDRLNYNSGAVAIFYSTTLTPQKALQASISIKDADAGEDFGSAVPLLTTESIATASGVGVYTFPIDFSQYKRYVQFTTKLDLTHTGTDTADYAVAVIKSGSNTIPAS